MEEERQGLERELANLEQPAAASATATSLLGELSALLDDWHGLLRSNGAEARSVLQSALEDRIRCEPVEGPDGAPMYRLQLPIAYQQILERVVPGLQVRVASPTGIEPSECLPLHGVSDLRAA